MNRIRNALAGAVLAAAAAAAGAATTLAGNLGDAGNGALVGSDLGAADFSDANAIADNVALYSFTLAQGGAVSVVSSGFAAGGVDPYFTLFAGADAMATFVDSNYAQATSTGGDFTWAGMLAAGSYEIALGAFENMSFAENLGSGTLGDGFIGLGDPGSLGNGSYSLTLATPVTEPSATWLMAFGLAALGMRVWRARRGA
jgi:hypothetical protein